MRVPGSETVEKPALIVQNWPDFRAVPSRSRQAQGISFNSNTDPNGSFLLPVVVNQALLHDGVEAGVLLDEDLAEVNVLAQENGLEADQFQQG
jgi:hypothetical protein